MAMTTRTEDPAAAPAATTIVAPDPDGGLVPSVGWGVLHLFFTVAGDRTEPVDPAAADRLLADFVAADERHQCFAFSVFGQRADLGLMLIAPDLAALGALHGALLATPLGGRLAPVPELGFVSLTEGSEYASTEDDVRAGLEAQGVAGDELTTRLAQTMRRLEAMSASRLAPLLPRRRAICFYPMSKRRVGADNWYALPYPERKRMMADHGASGRRFAGRIAQLVTTSTGLTDWEWGVTLLSDDPKAINDCVYTMRFDEVSARYGEFGPFVLGAVHDTLAETARAAGLTVTATG